LIDLVEGSGLNDGAPKREGTSAILVSTDGHLLLQLRDNLPRISDPGKIGLFGGQREGTETFLECVVREIHEEIGFYIPPERFELIGRYDGPDHFIPGGTLHGEVYVARDIPAHRLTITEGTLLVIALEKLAQLEELLAPPAKYALGIFLKRKAKFR
jgi:8-oxo-dGTP diphosphatase